MTIVSTSYSRMKPQGRKTYLVAKNSQFFRGSMEARKIANLLAMAQCHHKLLISDLEL